MCFVVLWDLAPGGLCGFYGFRVLLAMGADNFEICIMRDLVVLVGFGCGGCCGVGITQILSYFGFSDLVFWDLCYYLWVWSVVLRLLGW